MKQPRHALALIVSCLTALLVTGCYEPRRKPVSKVDPARADAGADGTRRDVGPASAEAGGGDACQPGFHLCGAGCVSDSAVETCGASCDPCPEIQGGTRTCEAGKCGGTCPAGKRRCLNACIDEAAMCEAGSCKPGENLCDNACVPASSLTACGSSCSRCPDSPNGVASCDGDKCSLVCNEGFHRCGDECVRNTDPETCGSSCTKCPAPEGGEPTCDGTKCGSKCPPEMKACAGKCIPMAMPCTAMCSVPGQIDCAGTCVSPTDVNFCGPMCKQCRPPANADATCSGTDCDFTCRPGFCRQGNGAECKDSKSVDSCGPTCEVCPKKENATATCNGTRCGYRCNTGFRDCNGVCKPADSVEACGAECATCSAPANGKPVCANGRCEFTCLSGRVCESSRTCVPDGQPCGMECPSGQRLCKGACVPAASITAEKCDNLDNDCDGQVDEGLTEVCSNKCATGTRVCKAGTWDSSACPNPAVQCCNDGDCPTCQECNSGTCRNQASGQDKKDNCSTGTCRTGNCDGSGKCAVKTGTVCTGGDLVTCNANGTETPRSCNGLGCMGTTCNQCAPGSSANCDGINIRRCPNGQVMIDGCGGRGCNPSAVTCCPTGTKWNGSQCAVVCGSNEHVCDGQCRSNTSPQSCGTSCSPCAGPIGGGGSATCVDGRCDFTCDAGRMKVDGRCDACGRDGQPCCGVQGTCASGHDCVGQTCRACGGLNQRCCLGSVCRDSGTVCFTPPGERGSCLSCGGPGQPCCSGNKCSAPGVCYSSDMYMHSNMYMRCGDCGLRELPCCAGNTCKDGNVCGVGGEGICG